MWAKRFPVPEFNRHELKDMEWEAPAIQAADDSRAAGMAAVAAGEDFYDRFSFEGEHLCAVDCKFPAKQVTVRGNSFAWPIQRVVITDSLNPASLNVLADWTTPRPMNTRLGPDGGITIDTDRAFVMIGHKFADRWVANRLILVHQWSTDSGNGFRILSSSEERINDFHDAIAYFEW